MSPERALVIYTDTLRDQYEPPPHLVTKAILAATQEERREALTWAAEACRQVDKQTSFSDRQHVGAKCAKRIESERDGVSHECASRQT